LAKKKSPLNANLELYTVVYTFSMQGSPLLSIFSVKTLAKFSKIRNWSCPCYYR
jgi:hypothetical protein